MVRIVVLIDRNRDSVRRICDLRYCVYDKSVILLAVIRRYNIEAVADIEKSRKVIFVSRFAVLCNIITAKLL